MYVMEDLIDVGLFYITDPHISVADIAIHCYHPLWTPRFLSRLAMLPLLVDSRTDFAFYIKDPHISVFFLWAKTESWHGNRSFQLERTVLCLRLTLQGCCPRA